MVSFSESRMFWSSLGRNVHVSTCAMLAGSCPQALKVILHVHSLHQRPWLTVTTWPSSGHNIRKAEVPTSRQSLTGMFCAQSWPLPEPLSPLLWWKEPTLQHPGLSEAAHLFSHLSLNTNVLNSPVLPWGAEAPTAKHQGGGWKGAVVHSLVKKEGRRSFPRKLGRAAAPCLETEKREVKGMFGSWLWELSSFYVACVHTSVCVCVCIMDVNLFRVQKWLWALARNTGEIQSEPEVSTFRHLITNIYLWAGHLSSYCSQ